MCLLLQSQLNSITAKSLHGSDLISNDNANNQKYNGSSYVDKSEGESNPENVVAWRETLSPGRKAAEELNKRDACPDTIIPPGSNQFSLVYKNGRSSPICGCNPNHFLHKPPSYVF